MRNETAMSSALSQNKHAFKEYVELFPECREVIAKKSVERLNKSNQQITAATPTSTAIQSSAGRATSVAGVHRNVGISTSFHTATAVAVVPLLNRNASPHQISASISCQQASRVVCRIFRLQAGLQQLDTNPSKC